MLFVRIWSSAQHHAVLVLLLNLVRFFISTWPSWSVENVLYHSCTSSEGASRRGQPLNVFTWFIGAGGPARNACRPICLYVHIHIYICIYVYTYHIHMNTHVCTYTYTYIAASTAFRHTPPKNALTALFRLKSAQCVVKSRRTCLPV